MRDWMERAEDELVDQVNSGQIDQATFDRAMRDLHQEAREHAQEAADHAYDLAMNR